MFLAESLNAGVPRGYGWRDLRCTSRCTSRSVSRSVVR